VSKGDFFAGSDIVKVDVLPSLSVWISVVEYPVTGLTASRGPWQVAAMSVLGHNFLADNIDPSAAPLRGKLRASLVCAVLVEIKGVSVRRMPGPGEDMAIVTPDEV